MNGLPVFLLIMLLSNSVPADSFRCGRSVVKVGDSVNVLTRKCGTPQRKYSSKETVNDQGRQIRAGVSNWVYGRKGRHDMIVSVRQGTIMKIRAD